jgi:hypothetical protein
MTTASSTTVDSSIAQRIESHRIVLSPHDDELYCFVTCTCTGYILYDPRNTWMNYTTLLLVGLIDSSMEEDPWLSLCGVEPAHTTEPTLSYQAQPMIIKESKAQTLGRKQEAVLS